MRLSITPGFHFLIIAHYITFMFLATFLSPVKSSITIPKVVEVRIERTEEKVLVAENTEDILHGALLFR